MIDTTGLDFNYLANITPLNDDERCELSCIDLENELQALQTDMASTDVEGIKFDKWDYIVAFTLGLLEVAGDFLLSDHNQKNSLANQMQDKNNPLGQAFESIHKKLDHSGQPMDYQGKGFGGGDHRGRTFCHDLLMFPLSLYMLSKGQFIDGVYDNGAYKIVQTALNQYDNAYTTMGFGESLIAYFTHMIADFFSTKSLPIPGFSLLTHFPNRDIRKFANDLYADGLNLRNLVMQGIPVATVELITWIYTALRYKDSTYSKEQIKAKKETMLLLTHGIATAVNVGKVIIQVVVTKDAKALTSLNLPMVIRTINLVWKSIKRELQYTNNRTALVYSSAMKNQLETEKTLILLDNCIYYTAQIDRLIADMKTEFDNTNERRIHQIAEDTDDLKSLLDELKSINGEEDNG